MGFYHELQAIPDTLPLHENGTNRHNLLIWFLHDGKIIKPEVYQLKPEAEVDNTIDNTG